MSKNPKKAATSNPVAVPNKMTADEGGAVATTKKPKRLPLAPTEEMTPQECRAVTELAKRRETRKPIPRVLVKQTGPASSSIDIEHNDVAVGAALLMDVFATGSADFLRGVTRDVATLSQSASAVVMQRNADYATSIVAGIQPRDEVETLLGLQMAAVHMATMTQANRLAISETMPAAEFAESALNKLARTFSTQVEALKRYRSKGEQRVYVERVTVNEGGQAIVGNVAKGEG